MESKISLIAIDIGGTLLSDDNTITLENIDAIKLAKSKNIKIALATAREFSSTKYISNQINCDYGVLDLCQVFRHIFLKDVIDRI